jgi:LPS-assembly protein
MLCETLKFHHLRTLVVGLLWPWLPLSIWAQDSAASSILIQEDTIDLRAQTIEGTPEGTSTATGDAYVLKGKIRIQAPEMHFNQKTRWAHVPGPNVKVQQGNTYAKGQELHLQIDNIEGYFDEPVFFFSDQTLGGKAARLTFIDDKHLVLERAQLTSCLLDAYTAPAREAGQPLKQTSFNMQRMMRDVPADQQETHIAEPPTSTTPPMWELRSQQIRFDFEKNEAWAKNTQLYVLGAPTIPLPLLSFPLGNERRSGWLTPFFRIDSRSGTELGAPYYWNIAPNQDATLTPIYSSRRGPSGEVEYRYLQYDHEGQVNIHTMPKDQLTQASRHALYWQQITRWDTHWQFRTYGLKASDDNYWKDFPRTATFAVDPSLLGAAAAAAAATTGASSGGFRLGGSGSTSRIYTNLQPRLLPQVLDIQRTIPEWGENTLGYARVQQWQVLQGLDPSALMVAPYQRSPQLGLTSRYNLPWGTVASVETEFNRFDRPNLSLDPTPQWRQGSRWHALVHFNRPWYTHWGWIDPKLSINTARYWMDAPLNTSITANTNPNPNTYHRTIPTFSLDAGLRLERSTEVFNRPLTHTLEPRVVYAHTPLQDQNAYPIFDTAPRDFNELTMFSPNAFSGIDRVSDSHQITAGLVSRILGKDNGAELVRGSLAQRMKFRDNLTTPEGLRSTQRLSDVLAGATINLIPQTSLTHAAQYNHDVGAVTASTTTARYSTGANRIITATYLYARNANSSVDARWLWPVWRTQSPLTRSCPLQISSAGRVNYNWREDRIIESMAGAEIDAGCWIGRLGVSRRSVGIQENISTLIFQIELFGLSRPAPNPFVF